MPALQAWSQPLYRGYLRHAPPPPADFPMCLRRCAASCLSFFSAVYPAFLCRTSRFDALGINDGIAWLRFVPGFLPGCFDQDAARSSPTARPDGRAGRSCVRPNRVKNRAADAATGTLFSRSTAPRLSIPACSTCTFASRNRVVLSLPTVHLSGRSGTPAALYRFFSCVYFTA